MVSENLITVCHICPNYMSLGTKLFIIMFIDYKSHFFFSMFLWSQKVQLQYVIYVQIICLLAQKYPLLFIDCYNIV